MQTYTGYAPIGAQMKEILKDRKATNQMIQALLNGQRSVTIIANGKSYTINS